LLNDVEKRVDAIEKKTDAHERDLSQVVWWGRLISIPILGLLIKEIFNIK
jgi:tetrahydromethanopterin S-methyltransferase subunit G